MTDGSKATLGPAASQKGTDDRIAVVVGGTSVGVSINLGDVVVSVNAPHPSGAGSLNEAQLRSAALRAARRALEVALQELGAAT